MRESHEYHQESACPPSMQEYAQAFRSLILENLGPDGEALRKLHAAQDLEKIHAVFDVLYKGIKKIIDNISLSEAAPFLLESQEDEVLNGDVLPLGIRKIMLHNLRNIIQGSRWGLFVERFLANPEVGIKCFLDTDKKVERFVSLTSLKGITSFSFFKECLTDFLESNVVHIETLGDWERLVETMETGMRFSILSQCVLELVENSIKSYYYYDKDPETNEDLDIPKPMDRPQNIHVSLELIDTRFRCTVTDTGKGIDPADLLPKDMPNLFRKGFSKTRGTGLGLANIRRQLLLAYGTIDATNNETEGSKFVLTLPVFYKY